MPTLKLCIDCGQPAARSPCTSCRSNRDRARDEHRGTSTARGYDAHHQAQRAKWAPKVATGTVPCSRCGELIEGAFDLDHTDDRLSYRGPAHPRCNRGSRPKNIQFETG